MVPSFGQSVFRPLGAVRRRQERPATTSEEAVATAWRKSSLSGADGCVEVRRRASDIQVRDSKDPGGPVLTFNAHEWRAFLGGARLGEFE